LAPVAESYTVTLAVPGAATSVLDTVAAILPEVPNCVGRAVPFHCITEVLVKPVPFAMSVNSLIPAGTQGGLIP
jgi:hypothetical protein